MRPAHARLARQSVHEVGEDGTREHALFLLTPDRFLVSAWHDLPLFPRDKTSLEDEGAALTLRKFIPAESLAAVVHMICHMPKR